MTNWLTLFDKEDDRFLYAHKLEGKDAIVTIEKIVLEAVEGPRGTQQLPIMYFKGAKKTLVLNKTNAKMCYRIFKSKEFEDWAGKKIKIYPTTTKSPDGEVDCIRIRYEQIK